MRSFWAGKKVSISNASGARSPVCPWCGIFVEPSGLLLTGDAIQCCPDHGCYVLGPSTFWYPQPMQNETLPRLSLEVQRLALTNAFTCLLGGVAGDYLVVYDLDTLQQYVQLELQGNGDGTIYVEVGSREWMAPLQPLSAQAVAALRALGFAGGGRARNYRAEGLFPDPHSLGQLTLRLFATAYPESEPFLLGILFKNTASAKACIERLVGQDRSSLGG
jgi:hypothetical protein